MGQIKFSPVDHSEDSKNTIRVSNSLDPDQARHFVGSDLGLNCLQRFCLFVCLFLLLYVPCQQLWSLRDGQFT